MYGGYDGSASQFAGQGGFMPTPAGATGTSPGAAAGARGQGRAESLVPLTVKQLETSINASSMLDPYLRDDVFRVNGEEVHNLTLLGKIVATDISSTSQMYTIDDGTGTVEVKMWVDTDDAADGAATNNRSDLKVGAYARVYGHLRAFQGVRNVIAFNMRPVTDFNEITYHFLEVVYCNSHNGVRAAAAAAAPGAGGAGAGAGVDGNAYAAPAAATMGNAAAAPAAAAAGDINQQVFAIFNGPQGASDQGVRVNDVVTQLNGRWTEEQVRGAVDHLVNEGHLYSTIDDDHFKSTLL